VAASSWHPWPPGYVIVARAVGRPHPALLAVRVHVFPQADPVGGHVRVKGLHVLGQLQVVDNVVDLKQVSAHLLTAFVGRSPVEALREHLDAAVAHKLPIIAARPTRGHLEPEALVGQ